MGRGCRGFDGDLVHEGLGSTTTILPDTKRPFVLIESRSERIDELYSRLKVEFPVVIGDATEDAVLREAQCGRAARPSRWAAARVGSASAYGRVLFGHQLRDTHLGLRVEEILVPAKSEIKNNTVGQLKARNVQGLSIVALRIEPQNAPARKRSPIP